MLRRTPLGRRKQTFCLFVFLKLIQIAWWSFSDLGPWPTINNMKISPINIGPLSYVRGYTHGTQQREPPREEGKGEI